MKYIINIILKFATFRGRAGRREFWVSWLILLAVFGLLYLLLSCLIWILSFMAQQQAVTYKSFNGMAAILRGAAFFVWALGYVLPMLALASRRLHDAGYDGWVLWAGVIIGGCSALMGWRSISLAVMIIYIALLCLPSRRSAERFGPPPQL